MFDDNLATAFDHKISVAVKNLSDYAHHRNSARAEASPFVASFLAAADEGARDRFAEAFTKADYVVPEPTLGGASPVADAALDEPMVLLDQPVIAPEPALRPGKKRSGLVAVILTAVLRFRRRRT